MSAPAKSLTGYFTASILAPALKDDITSMEHPIFALKAGDKRVRTYEHNGLSITVKPGNDGCATIYDKDLWIYCISHLVEAMNRGREDVGRIIQMTAYDFLVTTNRRTDGDSYKRLGASLARLSGTRIETNIATDKLRERAGFGLVDSWRIIERDGDGRMMAIEIMLPEWLWRSVKAKHVLTLNRDYFQLRKPLDRRIYELARKHCGAQSKWRVNLALLHKKSGSTDTLRKFRASIKSLTNANKLPDYRVAFDLTNDRVTFYARAPKGTKAQITDIMAEISKRKRP